MNSEKWSFPNDSQCNLKGSGFLTDQSNITFIVASSLEPNVTTCIVTEGMNDYNQSSDMHLHIQIVDFFYLKRGGGSTNLIAPICNVPNFFLILMSFCFFKSLRVMFISPVKQWFQCEMCIKSEIKRSTVKCKRPRGFNRQ